jgi:hypothetical protein
LLITLPNPYLEAPAHPSTLEVLRIRMRALTPYPSVVFTFRFAIESTKEFGGMSIHNAYNSMSQLIFFRNDDFHLIL